MYYLNIELLRADTSISRVNTWRSSH